MPTLAHEARVVGRLSLPMIVGNVAMYGMGFVDTLVVGPLGKDALAGVSMANNWAFACTVLGLGALRVVDPIVSQAHGAGDTRAVGKALSNALGLALALSLPMWALLATTAWVLPALGQTPDLVPFAARYCAVLALGVPGSFAFAALRQVLQGMGVVREATWVLLAANVVNLALVWATVYGLGWGPLGCAAATATCQTGSFFALRHLTRGHVRALAPDGVLHGVSLATIGQLLSEGLPLGVQMGMEAWAFTTSGLMIGWLGPTAMAAHSITLTLASLAFMVPLGIAGAGSTRVGNLIGAERPWGRAAAASLLLGCSVMSAFVVTFGGFAREVASLWRPEPEVLALCAGLLPIAATFSLFDGLQVVSFGILRGAGDLRVPSLANLVAYWVLGLPLGAWLAFREGMGAVGVWTGLAVGLCSVGLLLLARVAHIARRGARRVAIGG